MLSKGKGKELKVIGGREQGWRRKEQGAKSKDEGAKIKEQGGKSKEQNLKVEVLKKPQRLNQKNYPGTLAPNDKQSV